MAVRRLRRELEEVSRYGLRDVKSCQPIGDNLLHWRVEFYGPEDTPYEGGLFKVDVCFPSSYPLDAPSVKFRTVVYHPSVCRASGRICDDLLRQDWTPNKGVKWVIESLRESMAYPTSFSPLDSQVARQYDNDRADFTNTARKWTKLYAK